MNNQLPKKLKKIGNTFGKLITYILLQTKTTFTVVGYCMGTLSTTNYCVWSTACKHLDFHWSQKTLKMLLSKHFWNKWWEHLSFLNSLIPRSNKIQLIITLMNCLNLNCLWCMKQGVLKTIGILWAIARGIFWDSNRHTRDRATDIFWNRATGILWD